MSQDYTIIWAGDKTEPASYGQVKQRVKVDGREDFFNIFTKYPAKKGDVIHGDFVTVEKNGSQYTNFKFAKKDNVQASDVPVSESRALNAVTLNMMPLLEKIAKEVIIISERLDKAFGAKDDDFKMPFDD